MRLRPRACQFMSDAVDADDESASHQGSEGANSQPRPVGPLGRASANPTNQRIAVIGRPSPTVRNSPEQPIAVMTSPPSPQRLLSVAVAR